MRKEEGRYEVGVRKAFGRRKEGMWKEGMWKEGGRCAERGYAEGERKV